MWRISLNAIVILRLSLEEVLMMAAINAGLPFERYPEQLALYAQGGL